MIDRRKFLFTPLALACAADRPASLLLITATGWRGQAVPWAGDLDLVAPHLDAFGKQSVVFSRAYSSCAVPDLATIALLTAKFPHAATPKDERLGSLKRLKADAAITAFEKTPFFVHVELSEPANIRQPNSAGLHARGNIPSAKEPSARQDLAKFYGGCTAQDEELGRILAALDKLNLAQDTVVAFTSDCGQQFGSHGLDGDGVAFEESVRIPLAIRYPRKLQPAARDLASQVDILPTLLTLCGMEIPEGVQGQDLFGKNPSEVIFAELSWRMLLRGFDKIITTPKAEITHLFNLADDPFEMTNLVRDPSQKLKLASLTAQLQAQMKRLGDGMDPSGLRKR